MSSTSTSPATYAEVIGFPDWRGASEEWRQIKRDDIYRAVRREYLPAFEQLREKMEDLVSRQAATGYRLDVRDELTRLLKDWEPRPIRAAVALWGFVQDEQHDRDNDAVRRQQVKRRVVSIATRELVAG
jgi:hypothetical protein